MLDIDHFKSVNDTLGHSAGDELIISIASVLRQQVRRSDVLARLGGDEFAVLLPKADDAEATQIAQALVHAVRMNSTLPPTKCASTSCYCGCSTNATI